MDDKELLELAAEAAGLFVDDEFDVDGGIIVHSEEMSPQKLWNPLENDTDAFRLAVKLNLHVQIDFDDKDINAVTVYGAYFADEAIEEFGEPNAATRRAIVRAAAEIAKTNNRHGLT